MAGTDQQQSNQQQNQPTNQSNQSQASQETKPAATSEADKGTALFDAVKESGQTQPAEPKPGDLLSTKKADGTDKTAEELAADKTAHEAAEAAKASQVTIESLKIPEGIDVKSPLAKEFIDLANAKDLTAADRSQKLIDLAGKLKQDYDNKSAQLWLDTNKTWQTELINEIGEEKLEGMLGRISAQMEGYGRDMTEKFKAANPTGKPPDFEKELRQMMTLTGAGNNPAIIKFVHWMADQLGEGAPLSGRTPAAQTTTADKLYDRK